MLAIREATYRDVMKVGGVAHAQEFFYRFPKWFLLVGERNGAIIGIGGAYWDRSGQCWVAAPPAYPRYSLRLHKEATVLLKVLKASEQSIQVRRADVPTSARWLRHFGFEYSHVEDSTEIWEWRS